MSLAPSTSACEVCGCATTSLVFTATDTNRQIDDRRFDVRRCFNCGVGCTIPKLSASELSKYYTQEYYSLDNNLRLEEATRPHNQVRVDRVKQFIKSGKLLDIGAGTGMFLKTAKENGFNAEGLEITEDAAAFGRKTWGLAIRKGNIHETILTMNSYDVVTLGHVYEHLHNPRGAAEQLHSILRSGGLLVISVPNFDSFQARTFRSAWFHLDVPRHLFHYTPSSLKRLIESVGFEVVKTNFYSAEHNWAGLLGSIMKLSRPGESLPHKMIRKLVGVPVAKMLALVEASLGKGGTFELYAIKK
jgi:2-polyprenyl-3-methyl-5-hydroxy-6-metoxy-1,4-benzoquinol methylase